MSEWRRDKNNAKRFIRITQMEEKHSAEFIFLFSVAKKEKSSLINSFASSETEKNARSFIPFFSNFLRLDGIHGPPPSRRYICTKKGEESAERKKRKVV